MKNLFS
jgi:serine/threonine protein kinase